MAPRGNRTPPTTPDTPQQNPGAPVVVPGAPMANQRAPVRVALFPGDCVLNDPLDLVNSDRDMKFYYKAIKGIEDDKFDLKSIGLKVFLDKVDARAQLCSWDGVLNVPDGTGGLRNILTQYGNITSTQCVNHATAYLADRRRLAQNSMMLFHFLTASITDEARAQLTVDPTLYTVGGYKDGLCFLKLLISKSQVDTIATVSVLRNAIARMDTKMVEYSGNVTTFNAYIRDVLANLAAYGEVTPDSGLMNDIFRAYLALVP